VKTFARYLLFQAPGWALAAIVIAWLWPHTGLAAWMGVAAWAAWLAKDLLLYPLVHGAYETRVATGAERLRGATATALTRLDPCGRVRVAGECWRACAPTGSSLSAGTEVIVERSEGLTLHVRALGPAGAPRGGDRGERPC